MKKQLAKSLITVSLGISLSMATTSCAVLTPSKSFTVQGELPAHTGITFLANYYPENDASSACYYKDIASRRSELRDGTVGTDIPIKATPQHYQVTIPTQTYMGRCKVLLTGVSVVVENEENKGNRQTDRTGFIGIVDKTPLPATTEHPANFEINCQWYFRILPKNNNDILRIMNCTIAKNNNVSRNIALADLNNMNFVLNVNILDKYVPYYDDTWVKVKNGWKSCENKENPQADGFCTNPPKFRTFKLNGKTCSVYPTCTE